MGNYQYPELEIVLQHPITSAHYIKHLAFFLGKPFLAGSLGSGDQRTSTLPAAVSGKTFACIQ